MEKVRTIGILGGGQLGRMLALSAYELGFGCVIWDESERAPALRVTDKAIAKPYDDKDALQEFTDRADVAVLEFENIPVETVAEIEKAMLVSPTAQALAIVQDRVLEKSFFDEYGLPCAAWCAVASEAEALAAGEILGYPMILKTARWGYDGKGQGRAENAEQAVSVWRSLGGGACIAEAFIKFDKEASIIGVRSRSGAVAMYEAAENVHENHILRSSKVPANLPRGVEDLACSYLEKALSGLDIVGLLAMEMFIIGDRILMNEMAARPHNSGHWTQDAAFCSQFEQAIRAVAGLPLGSVARHSAVEMRNLLGDEIDNASWSHASWRDARARVHLYGKDEVRAGRKMGHINFLGERNG